MENKKKNFKTPQISDFVFLVIALPLAFALAFTLTLIMVNLLDIYDEFTPIIIAFMLWLLFFFRIIEIRVCDVSKLTTFLRERVCTWKWAAVLAVSIGATAVVWRFTDGRITAWFIVSLFFMADTWFSSSVDGYMNELNHTHKPNYPKPKSWIFESLLSIFLMPPLGIVATIYAGLSIKRYEDCEFEGSYRASILAYRWASCGVIACMMCLTFIFWLEDSITFLTIYIYVLWLLCYMRLWSCGRSVMARFIIKKK